MSCAKHTKNGVKQLLSIILALAFVISFVPVTVNAADTAAKATFENVSGDGGDNVISLADARTYKAVIPVDGTVDPASVTWTLVRNASNPYNDKVLYPNQHQGGALSTWVAGNKENFFSDVKTSFENGQLTASFSTICFFYDKNGNADASVPHISGGTYLDYCGYFKLTASAGGKEIGCVDVKIVPYDTFNTMSEIYAELDEMVAYAKQNTGIYVEKFSMGQSSGIIYDALDMPYIIIADSKSTVNEWLTFKKAAQEDPEKVLADIKAGKYNDIKVPVMFSNIHPNETAAVDGIVEFAWKLIKSAASDGDMSYNKLTGFTAEGKAQYDKEMEERETVVPDLVKDSATYLGWLQDGNGKSGIVDLDKYYQQETVKATVDGLLDDVFFVLVPEENVEGRTYITRTASNGYDLNRDNSFQTTNETQNMQKLIAAFNPVSLTEFHGRVQAFQCEPCDPPHEPNFEYDLLAEHLMSGGEALGIAAVANNDTYNSYVVPQRDYLYKDANSAHGVKWDAWDDMSTSYTPQFAMLHGTVAYTVELPGYNDAASALVSYGILGQADYIAAEKLGYLTAQTTIFKRGVNNENSDAYELVGQWFCDLYDVEGAESSLFRPEYDGQGQNGNFYPECYIIPVDGVNQTNIQAAADMAEWLSRNDVKILTAEKSFVYNGATYPAGTIVVSMYQAKRSVANGALYDGTLIQGWDALYSEGITAFNKTRGFDMVTVAEPAAYKAIKAACGDWMDYDDCLAYVKTVASYFTGTANGHVIISNASEDSVKAVNELLTSGKKVGMVTDENSRYYGDFVCAYADWQSVSTKYKLSGTGLAESALPAAKAITKAPQVFLTGAATADSVGFINTTRVSSCYAWNYDRFAMEQMGFATVTDASKADVIVGGGNLEGDALTAVRSGKPYIGYGVNRGASGALAGGIFGDKLVRKTMTGMDCLGYVTYPTKTLVNGSYIMDNDDIFYGYGAGYYTAIPDGAQVLVKMDGTKTPLEGFLPTITAEEKATYAEYITNSSIQGFAYEGKDKDGNEVNVVLFANTLTNKGHQRDEYAFISNFVFSSLLGGDYAASYSDVPAGTWYEDIIKEAVAKGLLTGTGSGKMEPNSNITRGQLITIIYRMAGSPAVTAPASMPFNDTKAGTWYSDAVVWGVQNEIIGGYGNGLFGVNDFVTREQTAAIIARYAKSCGVDTTADPSQLSTFSDSSSVSAYAVMPMAWAVKAGLINGDSGKLLPTGSATRAQAAAILIRYLDSVK